ncbi:YciI family protein [bacterium]|nr:YciI family protein [bacterium]
MQYMLMCCFDEKRWEEMPEAQRDRIMEDYGEFVQDIKKSGHFLAGGKLQSTLAATTVREKNGKRVTTDGPFAETKEQLGGYFLIECSDIDEALSIAGRIPTLPAGGLIEVRPVVWTSQK